MRIRPVRVALAVVAVAVFLAIAPRFLAAVYSRFQPRVERDVVQNAAREDAYRANNLGVALLEQFHYSAAADAFRRARSLDPSLAIAQVNLAIALLYVPDLDGAAREATEAARVEPRDPRPLYVLGLIGRERGRADEARAAFDRVLQIDPRDVGSHVNIGQILLQQQRWADAAVPLQAALDEEPYNITAAYNLGLALMRSGRAEEGQKAIALSQALRTGGYGTLFSPGYLQQGRYAEAVSSTGAEHDLVDARTPDVSFVKAFASNPGASLGQDRDRPQPFGRRFGPDDLADDGRAIVDALGGGITLLDFDGDGDLDVFVVAAAGAQLLRNDAGTFVDVTREAGVDKLVPSPAIGAVAGDYDNDGLPDLLVIRYGSNLVLHNDGGRFSDATVRSALPSYPYLSVSAAFVDFDHDGDLDIVISGLADLRGADERAAGNALLFPDEFPGAPLQFVRNNGNGTFTDISAQTKFAGLLHAVSIVATYYDNRRAVGLLVCGYESTPALLKNLRDGTFRDVASETGLQIPGQVLSAAVADFNKDDFPDFFFGRAAAPGVLATSDGHGKFTISSAPAASAGAIAAQFFDYDNDGLLDLITWSPDGPRLFRQVTGAWTDVTSHAFPGAPAPRLASTRGLVVADVDDDGDRDLIAASGGSISLWRNDGGNRNKMTRVRLAGRVSNRLGIGATIDMRAGSLRQRLETSASTPAAAPADVLFGLGPRPGADVLRVLWPSGVLQAETPAEGAASTGVRTLPARLALEELDRKPSSCPFLYTWNGERFEFVTDFMGGGEMGYWEAPGVRNRPDPDEYVRIRGEQLRPKDGRYELRATNELEEAMFVDRLQLLAITHADDVEVFPNEGMIDPPKPFRLFAARNARAPIRVVDDHGHDVTDRISLIDRRYPDDFGLKRIRGYAVEHTLTITFGAVQPDLLLLTGWTDYAFSSDNVAASQGGLTLRPPMLEARAGTGPWRVVASDIGIPVGRPQTLVVDLRRQLPADASSLRVSTNMRIYWDQIQVADAAPIESLHIARLDPAVATLRTRGFSAELAAAPPEPITYDYQRATRRSPWKTMAGAYTREGDVRPLLTQSDDRFVIAAPGDEIALSFDATRLAPLPSGSARTFLLFADGFSKEMDLNSASPDFVEPLPFHGMSRYPYPPSEHYPDALEYRRYRDEYNTRRVAVPFPSLDLLETANDRRRDR